MKTSLLITGLLFSGIINAQTQRGDELAVLKTFMKVCNAYKTLPVSGEIDIRNSANMILSAADTAHIQARFFLRKEGTYIDLGNMEQIADDSLLLLVSRPLKKMLLYANRMSVAQQLRLSIGLQVQDSSLRKLADLYEARYKSISKDTAEIVVTSRSPVKFTSLPLGTVRVRFDPLTFRPYDLVQRARTLRPVTETDYRQLENQVGGENLVHRDSSYYTIHERVTEYRYARMSHAKDDRLPVMASDRISRDPDGNYSPAAKFSDYSISKEF